MLAGAALAAGFALGRRTSRNHSTRYGSSRYSFAGRSVLVTGGSRGLGLVLARLLAAEGAHLSLLARDKAELERAADELRRRGAKVIAVVCDLRDAEQIGKAVDQAADSFGGIDVVINNAGVIQVGPMQHMTDADLATSLEVHAWGAWHVVQAALPHLRKRGDGRIVNICSIGGKVAMPHLLPYTAGKFAEVGLSDGLRAELRREGIYVTTVIPGLMRTGSPGHALFKGDHRKEHAWFAISDALPGISINAERAARKIVEHARRGATHLYITPQARLAAIANEVAPGLMARLMACVNTLLPRPIAHGDSTAYAGQASQSRWAPSLLTRLSDQAAERNNEAGGAGESYNR
jgi:NAD(P)-dependent dehydrogenase (short-subunit alcohol dehydrogenase family)